MTPLETVSHASEDTSSDSTAETSFPAVEKSQLWVDRARVLGVIAHPVRLAILELLCEKPRCVKHINSLVPLAQSHLSQHLRALRKANVIACLACGALRCYYVLQPTLVNELIPLLRREHPLAYRDCESIRAAGGGDRQD